MVVPMGAVSGDGRTDGAGASAGRQAQRAARRRIDRERNRPRACASCGTAIAPDDATMFYGLVGYPAVHDPMHTWCRVEVVMGLMVALGLEECEEQVSGAQFGALVHGHSDDDPDHVEQLILDALENHPSQVGQGAELPKGRRRRP